MLTDLIALTKPRIISLLLVTTITAMYIAGSPPIMDVIIVFVGGYLMAGGANAINMYVDRDIDTEMSRTKLRPIPGGRMHATAVLAFGIAIATAATFLLAYYINVLTSALALGGFYCYVFVYTRWLKRSTPQNIVIGGAAGAFPPLVGYAAVTGNLDITAWILFLIIFYWTPPHFWALALLKQGDYSAAKVPMAPLIWGEKHTADQIIWYTAILVAISILPVALGSFGMFYLISNIAITLPLVYGVFKIRYSEDRRPPSQFVFKYSLLYLALLFLAMVIDIQIT